MRDLRVKTGSIELQIREYERDATPVVFLHFGGGNLMMWQRAVPYFQERYRLILVDLRDHGKSDKPQAEAHIDQMARDVVGALDALGIQQAHIVGSSLGAEVGLSLAANFPAKVISLVCEGALHSEFGPYGVWEGSEAEFKEYVARILADVHNNPAQVFPSVAALVEESRQSFEKAGWWNEYVEAFQEYDAFEVAKGQFTHSWQNQAIEKYLEYYFDYRFEDYYRRVQCPLLMVSGADNEPEKTRAMQGLCQLTPRGKIVTVPGWIHPYGWLIDPEAMCRVVLEFLAEGKILSCPTSGDVTRQFQKTQTFCITIGGRQWKIQIKNMQVFSLTLALCTHISIEPCLFNTFQNYRKPSTVCARMGS